MVDVGVERRSGTKVLVQQAHMKTFLRSASLVLPLPALPTSPAYPILILEDHHQHKAFSWLFRPWFTFIIRQKIQKIACLWSEPPASAGRPREKGASG